MPQTIPLPVLAGIGVGLLAPSIFFCLEYFLARSKELRLKKQGIKMWQTFTPPKQVRDDSGDVVRVLGETVDFEPRHGHYLKCAEVLIALSGASLVFIPGLHLTAGLPWLAMPFVLFGFTVVYALSFMGLLTHFYEQFLYDPSSYGNGRMAINYGLGFGALACFAIAYFTIAVQLGFAYARGSVIGK